MKNYVFEGLPGYEPIYNPVKQREDGKIFDYSSEEKKRNGVWEKRII